ncbi:MAG: DUF371 domain-containing protein [Halodesulfurarchaeum sp.]
MAHEVVVRARGHEHVRGTHQSTFEFTTDEYLTPTGDCILGIEADTAPADFPDFVVASCQDADATISVTIEAAGATDEIVGRGDPSLTFESNRSMVGRTSTYVDDRTILLEADKAAADLDRDLIDRITRGVEVRVEIRVDPGT